MSGVDRYRPPREGYQPPSLPAKAASAVINPSSSLSDRQSRSPIRRRDIPPAVPTPPTQSSRTSPPRPVSHSQKSHGSPATSAPSTPARPPGAQWVFKMDELSSTPSVLDGMSPLEERTNRAKGVNFIYQAGIILEPQNLPQVTLWVAACFFHRFYMRHSMVEKKGGVHHYNIAATALFLANKTEENCCKTKNIIIAVAKTAQKNRNLIIDEQNKEYWRWRDSILHYEEVMLEALTFDLMLDHPYSKLYRQLEKLDLLHAKRMREAAWTFCNDCAMTSLPLLMESRDIALAALFFASNASGEKIDDVNGEPWWASLQANEDKIILAIEVIDLFFRENPLKKEGGAHHHPSPNFLLESSRRRGDASVRQDDRGSNIGTPLDIDRPVSRMSRNGSHAPTEPEDEESGGRNGHDTDPPLKSLPADVDMMRGDSDAALKVAANDLDHHTGKPAADADPLSAGMKRRSAEPEAGEPASKRRRESDGDEGEISEN